MNIIKFFRCAICLFVCVYSLKELMSHMRSCHGLDYNSHIICGIDNCPASYKKHNSFFKHCKSKHAEYWNRTEGARNNADVADVTLEDEVGAPLHLDVPPDDQAVAGNGHICEAEADDHNDVSFCL